MNSSETVLKVAGMTCGSCVRHVDAALRHVNGVSDVHVDLRAGNVTVKHDPTSTTTAMVDALRAAGYESVPSSE